MTVSGFGEHDSETIYRLDDDILSYSFVSAALDRVQTSLTDSLEELEAGQPPLMSPIDVQLEHAKKVAKMLGGMEVIHALSREIFQNPNE